MYYPHIDGIRAFAVLPVLLFHIKASLCPGGFAGVDVFFVISGYLITGGILRDLIKNEFTISNFYHRRIRRILPAYFAVVACVFTFGCTVYYILPLMHLADSTVMGSLFMANQYLWSIGGDYFSPDIHANPLLHLWSLSVEEQFYLLIPLIYLLIWKFRPNLAMPVVVLLTLVSFVGAVYAIHLNKQTAAFYLLPFRAWELLAGSFLAILMISYKATDKTPLEPVIIAPINVGWGVIIPANSETWRTVLAITGLLMVMTPYLFYSQQTPFPGAAALPSVIGTILLIRYGIASWVGKLLSWQPLVAIGKISYSLYLWHWPVIVYWKYVVYNQLYSCDYIGIFLSSFLLASLSWRFVELPVRTSSAWTRRSLFTFAAMGIVLLVSAGLACIFCKGWSVNLHPTANKIWTENDLRPQFVEKKLRSKIAHIQRVFGYNEKNYNHPTFFSKSREDFSLGNAVNFEILLIGDSHAGVLQFGMDASLRERNRGGRSTIRCGGAVFILGNKECNDVLATLSRHPEISKVILASYWKGRMKNLNNYKELEKFSNHLKSMGKTLFIATDTPCYKDAPGDRLAKEMIIGTRRLPATDYIQQSEEEYRLQQGEINHKLEKICYRTGAVLVPLHHALKGEAVYNAVVIQNHKISSLYRDDHHLSQIGSIQVAQFIMKFIFP